MESQSDSELEMMLGVVIPTFNRRDNLRLSLESLAAQSVQDYLVLVADDGSTDGTRTLIQELRETSFWRGRLDYVWCGPNQGIRPGRARNVAIAGLPRDLKMYLLLDSDIILEPHAVQRVVETHEQWNSALIQGLVNWLAPMPTQRLLEQWITKGFGALEQSIPVDGLGRVEGTYAGPDLRLGLVPNPFCASSEGPRAVRAEWTLSSLLACPSVIYGSIGGFDEGMTTYGYDDIEFGARAQALNVQCVFSEGIRGVHIWHPKPNPALRVIEEQWNLDYVLRRYGHNATLAENIDWACWWHYHSERGGTLLRVGNNLWATNAEREWRIRLPSREWMAKLGYSDQSIAIADEEAVSSIPVHPANWAC